MKNVVITGTSRGIGYELVKLFANEGHRVLALSRNEKPIKKLALSTVEAMSYDLEQPEDLIKVTDFIEAQWEKVDVLIHNAGLLVNKPFLELTKGDFESVYSVNVLGVVYLTQKIIPLMDQGSHVVVVSSMGGVRGSSKFPGLTAYSSSKGAVITLGEVLAEEFKDSGISFNTLALGAVQTEMLTEAFPGYQAPIQPKEMAAYIKDFSLNGQKFYNGKVLEVSSSTP